MKAVEFCYWLQGFFEISGCEEALTGDRVRITKNHLALVFKHEIDPSYSADPKVQVELQAVHDGKELTTAQIEALATEASKKLPHSLPHTSWSHPGDTLIRC